MILIPYERIKIKTNLGKTELLQKLEDSVEPRVTFRSFRNKVKPYEGSITGSHFEISRILWYRNSFKPMISGDITSEITGSSISIIMNLHIIVNLFMVFWFFITGMLFIYELDPFLASLRQAGAPNFDVQRFPGYLFLFGYALMQVCFKIESTISKNFLRELFQAEEFLELGYRNPFRPKD